MQDLMDNVGLFMRACGQPTSSFIRDPSPAEVDLRIRLIDEEVNIELIPALKKRDIVGIADGAADAIYVILGTALTYGERPDECWWNTSMEHMFQKQSYKTLLSVRWHDRVSTAVNGGLLPLLRGKLQNRRVSVLASTIQVSLAIISSAAMSHGIPMRQVWDEVQRTNVTKIQADGKVLKNEFGKVMKPAGWTKPDIEGILRTYGVIT